MKLSPRASQPSIKVMLGPKKGSLPSLSWPAVKLVMLRSERSANVMSQTYNKNFMLIDDGVVKFRQWFISVDPTEIVQKIHSDLTFKTLFQVKCTDQAIRSYLDKQIDHLVAALKAQRKWTVGLHFLSCTVVDDAVIVSSHANFASSVALVKRASVIVVVLQSSTF